MCISVIGKIVKLQKGSALINIEGILKEASTVLKPQAKAGDYVLLHAGFIIEIMPPKEAKKALKDIRGAQL